MCLEATGGCKFAKLVTYHVFCYIDCCKCFASVNKEGKTDKVRDDHGGAAPGFDWLAVAVCELCVYLVKQGLTDEGSFFE